MRTTPRRFSLSDAMVMIAATAIGFAGSIYLWNIGYPTTEFGYPVTMFFRTWAIHDWHEEIPKIVFGCIYLSLPGQFTCNLALSLLALKRPHYSIRWLTRQPGVVGCWAASIAILWRLSRELVSARTTGNWYLLPDHMTGFTLDNPTGPAILSVWLISLLNDRWRPEPTWLDRSGRIMSVIWIVETAIAPHLLPLW